MFRIYDDDDAGLITVKNLQRCSKDLEELISNQEIHEMIRMGEKSRRGGVNLDEFMELMKELELWGQDRDKDSALDLK